MNCFANWEAIDVTEKPTARWGHSSYMYKENIYIYGGYCGNNSKAYIGDVDSINITTKGHQRYAVDDIPPRSNSASIGIDQNFLIHGGRANKNTFSDLLCYDCSEKRFVKLTEQNKSEGPGNRAHHSCCRFRQDYLLYYGGDDMEYEDTSINNSRESKYTTTYLLHIKHINEHKVRWDKANIYIPNSSEIDIYPKPRRFHTMIEHKPTGSIILYGGSSCTTRSVPFNDVWIFTPLSKPYTGSWIRPKKIKGDIPFGRWGHTMSYVNNEFKSDSFVIFGGYTNTSVNVIYILTLTKYPVNVDDDPFNYEIEWSLAKTSNIIPPPRRRHSICQDKGNNCFYIFGGYSTKYHNDLYRLDINVNADENLSELLDKCNAKALHPILLENNITYNRLKYFSDIDYDKYNIPLGVRRQIQSELNSISIIHHVKDNYTNDEYMSIQKLINEYYNCESINKAMKILVDENRELSYDNLYEVIDEGRKSMVEDIKNKEILTSNLMKEYEDLKKEKTRRIKESKSENICCVCMERTPDVIVLPCGHFCLCSQCISNILEKKKKCPLCGNIYTELVKLSDNE